MGNWIDELTSTKKKQKSTTKMTPMQASLKTNEEQLYNILDEKKKLKPKLEIANLVGSADKKNFLYSGDSTK